MPRAPRKPCARQGCPALVDVGVIYCERCALKAPPAPCRGGCGRLVRFPEVYCQRCRGVADRKRPRGTAHERGYGYKWQKRREVKLHANPLCERCETMGKLRLACQVHHIDHNTRNNDYGNLMSVCVPCHAELGR